MKNSIKILISILLLTSLAFTSAAADKTPFNWYCAHTKGETVPTLDPRMSFIDKYDSYYIDKNADQDNKSVYLTFDAGYENGNVEKVLDTLKEKNVKGAFFILENLASRNPDLVRRMANEGHLVCNHTAKHYDMTTFDSYESFCGELQKLNDAVYEKCGVAVSKYFRPPEGRFSEENLLWASQAGYKTVFWSFAYADWDNNRQMDHRAALDKIMCGAHPGEVLLLHPTSATNAAILGDLIDCFRAKGYTFKTLDDLTK